MVNSISDNSHDSYTIIIIMPMTSIKNGYYDHYTNHSLENM